ncbi:unnamed protein product [Amoebophrya sp. A120]|nr:unnamed protein product [Amoebophrya sp. A120]|eukprot:GSA120T00023639001.1
MKEKDHDSKQQKEALLDAGYPETQVELMMTMLTDPASDATYEERAKNVAAAYQRGVFADFVALDQDKNGKLTVKECPALASCAGRGREQGANITAIATAWATSHREDATSLQISATGRTAVDVREAELVCNQMGQASFREMEQSTATKMQQAWAKRPSCVSDGIWSCCSSAPQQLENKLAEAEEYMEELTDLVELYVREKYINKVADAAAVKNMAKAASHLMLARDLLKGML